MPTYILYDLRVRQFCIQFYHPLINFKVMAFISSLYFTVSTPLIWKRKDIKKCFKGKEAECRYYEVNFWSNIPYKVDRCWNVLTLELVNDLYQIEMVIEDKNGQHENFLKLQSWKEKYFLIGWYICYWYISSKTTENLVNILKNEKYCMKFIQVILGR